MFFLLCSHLARSMEVIVVWIMYICAMRGRQHRRQDDRETAGAGGEVCADLTGRSPMAYNGSEYLLVALRRETRFGFVKALLKKRSETIKDAMIDMQLLLRGVWRFHSDEGREFMGAVDDWLREHTILHTTTGAYDPNANSLVEESVGARKRDIRCLLHQANAPECLCLAAAEYANEIYNHTTNDQCLARATWWIQLCWKDVPFRDKLYVTCCRERPSSWPPSGCLAFAIKLEHPTVRRGSLDPIALQGRIFVGWNRRVPHGIKIATFRDDGEVEESRVRLCKRVTQCSRCASMLARSQRLRQSSRSSRKCEGEAR